jgi:hypothetical protein
MHLCGDVWNSGPTQPHRRISTWNWGAQQLCTTSPWASHPSIRPGVHEPRYVAESLLHTSSQRWDCFFNVFFCTPFLPIYMGFREQCAPTLPSDCIPWLEWKIFLQKGCRTYNSSGFLHKTRRNCHFQHQGGIFTDCRAWSKCEQYKQSN